MDNPQHICDAKGLNDFALEFLHGKQSVQAQKLLEKNLVGVSDQQIADDPELGAAFINLAIAYERNGKPDLANQAFARTKQAAQYAGREIRMPMERIADEECVMRLTHRRTVSDRPVPTIRIAAGGAAKQPPPSLHPTIQNPWGLRELLERERAVQPTPPQTSAPVNLGPAAKMNAPSPEFKVLLELAMPEVYDRNAFRILEVSVEATGRDLSKRRQMMEAATRNKLSVPNGPLRICPKVPAPDEHEVRDAAHAIQDAERRLVHEFFWLWPANLGTGGDDEALRLYAQSDSVGACALWQKGIGHPEHGAAALHNLAVVYHWAALQFESQILDDTRKAKVSGSVESKEAETDRGDEAMSYWAEALGKWKDFWDQEAVWSRVNARIRTFDDQSLTSGAAKRLRNELPVALMLINLRLAIRAYEKGGIEQARRQVGLVRWVKFPEELVDQALNLAVEPPRALIKNWCEAANKETESDPSNADKVAERLIGQSERILVLLDILLPKGHPARLAEHDQVALAIRKAAITFGNKTKQWEKNATLLELAVSIAGSASIQEQIAEDRESLEQNIKNDRDFGTCWFCGSNLPQEECAFEYKMHGEYRTQTVFVLPDGKEESEDDIRKREDQAQMFQLYYSWEVTGKVRRMVRKTWKNLTIKVPRCKTCQKHQKMEPITCLSPVLWLFIIGLLSASTEHRPAGFQLAVFGVALATVLTSPLIVFKVASWIGGWPHRLLQFQIITALVFSVICSGLLAGTVGKELGAALGFLAFAACVGIGATTLRRVWKKIPATMSKQLRDDVRQFPRITELCEQGWKAGDKPEGVQ